MQAARMTTVADDPQWGYYGFDSPPALSRVMELPDQAATEALAERVAGIAVAGDVSALRGDLGAGTTVFARAFVRALCAADEEVPSPTFTLVQQYEPAGADAPVVWHFDLFRVETAEEALELDIDDAFATGISLIEWPDRLATLLPSGRLDMTLLPGADSQSRRLRLAGNAQWLRRLREAGLA